MEVFASVPFVYYTVLSILLFPLAIVLYGLALIRVFRALRPLSHKGGSPHV